MLFRLLHARLVMALLLAGVPALVSAQSAPTNLRHSVLGADVQVAWDPPSTGGVSSYRLEAGSGPGLANIATFAVAQTQVSFTGVPNGSYFVRVRTVLDGAVSAPSNEVIVTVAPPGPPSNLTASVSGTAVSLEWTAPTTGGAVQQFIVEAGSAAGATDLARLAVPTTSFSTGGVPPRLYFTRVRAASSAGVSAPSNEVEFVVSDPLPGPPLALSVTVSPSAVVQLSWQPPESGGQPTAYRIEAGTGPGLANLAQLTVGDARSFSTPAPVRVYFVRVRAVNATGVSLPSNEVVANVTGLSNGIPVAGVPVPPLSAFDDAMTAFMASRGIGAAALAISAGGAASPVLFERAYGWSDGGRTQPLLPDTPFRTASVSKPITASVLYRLVAGGRMTASDYVFCTGSNQPCHLSVVPWGTPDPRLGSITVAHLLAHRGGWDRAISGDPMFNLQIVATDLGLPSPVTKQDVVRWLAGRPLDFTPGTREAYSNVGYLLLGQVIEQVTGRSYESEMQQSLFGGLGVAPTEVYTGRSLPADRNPREPVYEDPFPAISLFPPYSVVPWPDGGLLIEAFEAHGGVVATGHALARFLSGYWMNGQPRTGGSQDWTFYGSMPGTLSMARQLPNGINLAVLFNTRYDRNRVEISGDAVRLVLEAVASRIDWGALDEPWD